MFLRLADYDMLIAPIDRAIITQARDTIRLQQEVSAQEEISMYIRQRYDLSKIFIDCSLYVSSVVCNVGQLIYYNVAAYDSTHTYAIGDRCSYRLVTTQTTEDNIDTFNVVTELIYKCNTAGTTGTFNVNKWDYVTENNAIYSCILQTTVSPVVLPDNTTYFKKGDTRNAKIVEIMLQIVLYKLHVILMPQNVPLTRLIQYNGGGDVHSFKGSAIDTLEKIANGKIMVDIPALVPDQGYNIGYGSNVKLNLGQGGI